MSSTMCQVDTIEQVSSSVYKISLIPESSVSYKAGQYLQVVMNAKDKRPFSIANAPFQDSFIELHIGATPENAYAYEVLQACQNTGQLEVEIGLGTAYLRNSPLPAIIVAGGTGYSYAKAILQAALKTQPEREIVLYWGAKTEDDLYEKALLEELTLQYPNFSFRPVVEHPSDQWEGRTGWVHLAVLKDYETLEALQVYTAGRFEMASAIRNDFVPHGLDPEHLFGDAFSYI